jgi:hypothetical protein
MGDIILDLGSKVNVFPKKTWQCMGEPTLGYSHVKLKLTNQHRVFQLEGLKGGRCGPRCRSTDRRDDGKTHRSP